MLKAMLIDDEKIALDVLEILLNEIGGVTVASKCQIVSEALAQAEDIQPDIIFLDIEMPGMNGLEAGKHLIARCPDAEIIIVTAYDQYSLDAFGIQAIDYLLKPVAKSRLTDSLERYARLHRKRSGINQAVIVERADEEKLVQLKVLGSMELYGADGKLITWRTKKTKELFAYLWKQKGKPVYRYSILEDLWPDVDSEKAQALLHTTLYNLRSMLRAEGFPNKIRYGDERYWMTTEWISSDLERLEAGMGDECLDAIELLAIYSGDFLEMEHYQWAEPDRLKLRQKFAEHLRRMCESAKGAEKDQLLLKLNDLEPVLD